MTNTETKLSFDQVIATIRELSYSQGFYGRLLRAIEDCEENDPSAYDDLRDQWDNRFTDAVDFILYIES